MFINDGKIVLNASMEDLPDQYVELLASGENVEAARRLNPIYERQAFGKKVLIFEGVSRDRLQGMGEIRTPGVADLFVAKVKGAAA